MNIIGKIKDAFRKAFTTGWSVEKLTLSFCMGIYIAFSPFPGAHTIMMIIATWLFKLNFPVLFIATSLNNPWTMIPFFTFDYIFGYWFLHDIMGYSPGWVISLAKFMGSGEICLMSFLIGGNVLGIFFGLTSYPLVSFIFKRLINRLKVT